MTTGCLDWTRDGEESPRIAEITGTLSPSPDDSTADGTFGLEFPLSTQTERGEEKYEENHSRKVC